MFTLVPLIILFPTLGMLINLTLSGRMREPGAGIVASTAAGLSFAATVVQFFALLSQPQGATTKLLDWIDAGGFKVDWAFQVDTLSVTMMLVVTGVGTLIHVYAIGYMHGDERFTRFFIYMNLFLVMMLVLVSANNYLMLFTGWEGVGLCSYLLIGFWFDKPNGEGWKNSSAARKAFLVNRVGDFGFLLAIMLIWWTFGSLSFHDVFESAPLKLTLGAPVAAAMTLLLLLGAVGKSAQIPLFVWLPDAMAGPTPVSALIHAATMVTAGIYLIVRSHVLFALAPFTQEIIVLTGAITALMAASIAVGQYDIKRVLAYSTISQLGFMIAAVGMGAYAAGMFHLVTHAFFKALLFLGAGSVIHALGHGNDMRSMGGLRTRMPVTFWTYVIGSLSLAGIAPLAGFFSKDEILNYAAEHSLFVYLLLSAAAFLTAFYIGRQIFTVFLGETRSKAAAHAVENPPMIIGPLLALAGLSVLGGAINLPGAEPLVGWLGHSIGEMEPGEFQPAVAGVSLALAVVGLGLAYWMYGRKPQPEDGRDPLEMRAPWLFNALQQGWWVDKLYERTIIRLYNQLGTWLARTDYAVSRISDQTMIRLFNGVGAWLARADDRETRRFDERLAGATQRAAALVEKTETRQLNWNMVGVIAGLVVVLTVIIWMGGR